MKSDQNIVFDVTGYDGDVTRIVETIPSHSGGVPLVSRLASYQGLILISSERPDYTITTTFEPPLRSVFTLPVGAKAIFTTRRRVDGNPEAIARLKLKPDVAGTMTVTVLGHETVRVGDCSYRTIVVDRELRNEGEQPFWNRHRLSPDLRVSLVVEFRRESPEGGQKTATMRIVSIASK